VAGLGTQPVEGRFDIARFDGDPDSTTPGVWDGDTTQVGLIIPIPAISLKRTPPSQLVRRP
jgi:hypothetical protein